MMTSRILGCSVAIALASVGQAQYTLHSWYNFEDGKLPTQLVSGHYASDDTLKILGWQQLTQFGGAVLNPEVGSGGPVFIPTTEKPQISMIATTSMDRRRLQPGWKALYQADFYLHAPGANTPTVALLAITPNENTRFSYNFYRFGVLEGGDRLFFSFSNNTPEPVMFESQKISDYNLQLPGWHRFQIIFEGQDKIAFAIDTVETSFSPIQEPTLTLMHPGLMVSSTKSNIPMLVDNLSIQWTSEPNSPLPQSPWTSVLAGAPAQRPASPNVVAPIYTEGSRLTWHTDTQSAWKASQEEGKPILTMFYAPKIAPFEYLNTITPKGASTEELMSKFVLLKVDANQLAGGKLAADYRVMRLPTFIAISQDSREKGRFTVVNHVTKWEEVASQLAGLAQ